MNRITINGRTYNNLGGNVSIINGDVFVDGKLIETENETGRNIKIEVIGNIDEVVGVDSLIVKGNLNRLVKVDGSIQVEGEVSGNVTCGGSCIVNGEIKGDVKANGSVIVNK